MATRGRAAELLERIGHCVELVPLDPNFHDITVGLYVKDGVATVSTFSHKPGVEKRIEAIRDQLIALGGMTAVEGAHDKVSYDCGQLHERPLKFLMKQAVEKPPDHKLSDGRVKDLRSPLMLDIKGSEENGRWVYRVDAEGEAPNEAARLRAVTGGLSRYGDMEKIGDEGAGFTCGYRHDELARLVLPFARNVSQVEDMLAADAMRGQMTTGTLGFTPPT
jgi:hypothetical protein